MTTKTRGLPTIRDVAAAAGVSVTTVSHVLNGKGRIDPDTRELVRKAAAEIGYHPNRSAQSLRLGRTGTLGLLLPQFGNVAPRDLLSSDWYGQVSLSAARAAFARDRALLLLPVDEDPARFLPLVDGVIAVDPTRGDARLAALDRAGAQVVTLDHFDATRHDCRYVLPDTQTGVHRLLDHLLEQGATSIAAIFVDADWSPLSESLTAYEAWMASRGLTPRLAPVGIQSAAAFGEVTRRTYVVARDLLSGGGRPDAVIALFGGFAIEVLRAARDLNLRCPEDLLVAQDIDGARERSIDRGVTAIDLRPDLQAEAAVGMLLDILDGREPPTHHVTPVDLNVRSTTLRRR